MSIEGHFYASIIVMMVGFVVMFVSAAAGTWIGWSCGVSFFGGGVIALMWICVRILRT